MLIRLLQVIIVIFAISFLYYTVVGISFFGIKMREDKDLSYSLEEIVDAAMKINSLTLEMEKGLRLWRWFDTPQYRIIKNNTKLLERFVALLLNVTILGEFLILS